jgi:hypothetical protein
MVDVLNKAGPFSKNSEVVIAAPSIHLSSMMCAFRPEISVAAEDVGFKKGYGAYTGKHIAFYYIQLLIPSPKAESSFRDLELPCI